MSFGLFYFFKFMGKSQSAVSWQKVESEEWRLLRGVNDAKSVYNQRQENDNWSRKKVWK